MKEFLKEKNNKKNIIIGIIIIGVIAIGIICILMYLSHDKKEENEKKELSFFHKYTIESTEDKPIKKDNIEVKKIEILHENGNIEITTILNNTSDELIDGFFITIEIYDEKGKKLTEYSVNREDKIEAHKDYELKNFATIEEEVQMVSAKITYLDGYSKKTIDNNLGAIKENAGQ